jgi:hypothetical protein
VEGQTCEVTVVASVSGLPAFSIETDAGEVASLTLRDVQPLCGSLPFIFVAPDVDADNTAVTLDGLIATTACSKKGPLLATANANGRPYIFVTITDSVLTHWTSEGWDSSDTNSTNEGGLLSLDHTRLKLTGSVLADNSLSTSSSSTGGGFISASGDGSVVTLTDNLFVLSDAATQDRQGTMFRFTSGAQATVSHNLFIDQSGVTADYAPLIHVGGRAALMLDHNLVYGATSTVPVGTGDGTIPTLNNNLFLGLRSPWQIEADTDSGVDVFDPDGTNNWAQAGVTNDFGGPLHLGDLQLKTLAELWADLAPDQPTPTTSFASVYDSNDPADLAIWPDSCSPLLDLDPVPGVLGGGGGDVWRSVLDLTTAYDVTWYCSNNVSDEDGTLCFEETADPCAARANGDTCKTVLGDGDECQDATNTDSGADDSSPAVDSGTPAGTTDGRFGRCGEARGASAALTGLLGLLAFATRRRD